MNKDEKIYIAGHNGMVGSAITSCLLERGYENLLLRSRAELDLTDSGQVLEFFHEQRPAYVFLAAAKVGGIKANSDQPVDFLRDNMQIQLNVIDSAHRSGVNKLQFLGSSCIYPRLAPQPISEQTLLGGELEPTNEWYAIAKIAGIKLCQAYRKQHGFDATALMPTNLYGPGDNFNLQGSHVLPALMRKCHEAKIQQRKDVSIWGSGRPLREFMHVDDLADACVYLMVNYSQGEIINVGTGNEISIKDLAVLMAEITGFSGELAFDSEKPDGTPRKLLDVSKLAACGWVAKIGLKEGIEATFQWYLENQNNLKI